METETSARNKALSANSSTGMDGKRRVRVMCPVCNTSGGTWLYAYQPKCHVCVEPTLMEPANNSEIVCTWQEAVAAYTELDNRLGNEIKR